MTQARLAAARPLIAVEVSGDNDYLVTLPATRQLQIVGEGCALVWLDAASCDEPILDTARPERPPEVELHGQGAMPSVVLHHPRAQFTEAFFDGLGDPVAAPMGWWHARVWLRAA